MPRKKREEYNAYMRQYLPDYRKKERQMINAYKEMFKIPNGRKKPSSKRRKT